MSETVVDLLCPVGTVNKTVTNCLNPEKKSSLRLLFTFINGLGQAA